MVHSTSTTCFLCNVMKYYIIAGEPSGDLQASYLLKELKVADQNAEIRCFGGDLMEKQGATLVKHYKEMAFMGFEQVILNLRTILKNIKCCKQDILNYQPDVLILVDYPGFNLKIAKWAKVNNIKVYYYISPKIWAWNQKRVYKIKENVEKMFSILPFEKEFYAKYNYKIDYVGHPLLDTIADRESISLNDFKKKNQLNNKPIIAILPGSRKQEIAKLLSLMSAITDEFPNYQFVIAGAPSQPLSFYKKFMQKELPVVQNQTYDLLQNAHAAMVASGTASLETALFKVPQVVCYKVDYIFYKIAMAVVKVDYASLVNLIMNKEVVKELIQFDFNRENLVKELNLILDESNRKRILSDYDELHQKLGGKGASKRAAELMVKYLSNS